MEITITYCDICNPRQQKTASYFEGSFKEASGVNFEWELIDGKHVCPSCAEEDLRERQIKYGNE